MTAMMWVTAATTALTTVTQTRQTQTTTERETPVLWTSMEMVRTRINSRKYENRSVLFNK